MEQTLTEFTITPVSVGVDWLTVTASEGKQRDMLLEYGIELMMADAAQGNRVTPYKMARYYGGHTKHVGVGEWQGRVLVAVGGAQANDEAPELLALAQNCSRIDLQVSVRQEPYDPMLAFHTWLDSYQERTIEGKPSQYDLYARQHGGTTLYIGDGSSRYLARLYERFYKTGAEADRDVWRYEVEAKRERAAQAVGLLRSAADPVAFTRSYVYQHFSTRGVVPIFQGAAPFVCPPLEAPEPDKARSLRWLAKSVRPALKRLDAWGAHDEWLRALDVATDDVDDIPLASP